jgi:hypothetical protein
MIEGRTFPRESPLFKRVVEWISYIAQELRDPSLMETMLDKAATAFEMPRNELYAIAGGVISGIEHSQNGTEPRPIIRGTDHILREILPQGGWFEWYDLYTEKTESPLSYHITSSMCVLGAALGRRVYMDMGFFKVFPNWCSVLIGPTGRVKKTSAANIARGLISTHSLCPIMADAITPEALATALSRDGGHQLVYAPEFAVLFNRQKYNETLTTRIIRLLDCPDTFEVETVGRGKEEITNVALTFLGCSTPSLFTGATPEMVTSSGFLNRFLLVIEDDTDREYPIPERGPASLEVKLKDTISFARKIEGRMDFGTGAYPIYAQWYHERRAFVRSVHDEIHAEAIERGADHLLRTAMLMHIAQCRDSRVCVSCMEHAIKFLAFIEKSLPTMVNSIRKSQRDADAERILTIFRRAGKMQTHSDLLRKSRLDAGTFKRAIGTLVESRVVDERKQGSIHLYILREEATGVNA